jgi:transcriptional regulator with XRE-family HTH domain
LKRVSTTRGGSFNLQFCLSEADIMVDRIKEIMLNKGLSPSQFADSVEVPRPVLSHVLSGRNKPSLEVVQKILLAFPEIDMAWLLLGQPHSPNLVPTEAPAPSPDEGAARTVASPEMRERTEREPGNVPSTMPEPAALPASGGRKKKVEKIVFFYADQSFSEYFPE